MGMGGPGHTPRNLINLTLGVVAPKRSLACRRMIGSRTAWGRRAPTAGGTRGQVPAAPSHPTVEIQPPENPSGAGE